MTTATKNVPDLHLSTDECWFFDNGGRQDQDDVDLFASHDPDKDTITFRVVADGKRLLNTTLDMDQADAVYHFLDDNIADVGTTKYSPLPDLEVNATWRVATEPYVADFTNHLDQIREWIGYAASDLGQVETLGSGNGHTCAHLRGEHDPRFDHRQQRLLGRLVR